MYNSVISRFTDWQKLFLKNAANIKLKLVATVSYITNTDSNIRSIDLGLFPESASYIL